ncbi:MAG: anthranilate synthase component I [Methanosarcinales archaeon]|nr:anthranilate synthase component I [Methanosarcinales archaeon]
MNDIHLDLSQDEFIDLANNDRPAIIQLRMKTQLNCSPFELYIAMKQNNGANNRFSYLLESMEKEQRHARFSFVGSDPDAVVTVKDRVVSLEYPSYTPMIMHVEKNLSETCHIKETGDCIVGDIKPGFDTLDAVRSSFPAYGVNLINSTGFERQTFLGGAIGFNSYDLIYDCWLDRAPAHSSDFPDARFALVSKTVVFDHMSDTIHLILTPFIGEQDDAASIYQRARQDADDLMTFLKKAEKISVSNSIVQSSITDVVCTMEQKQYEEAVTAARQHIIDGNIFQVVLSRRYEQEAKQTPVELYQRLREVNPSPYMYLFEFNDTGIIGASPETLMTVYNKKLITNPIAGTCPRGTTPEEDKRLAQEMLNDEKERAEHVMLVDLGRNDVRMVCASGTVKVDDFMSVLKYSHLQHIESTVSGQLRKECDQFDATRAVFPAGTLSGAPKIRAMEIIDEMETAARGIYGGGVGYYSINGDADFAIVIRTVIIKANKHYIQAGAGIVADSDPTYEYNETERKMAAMMKALGGGA